MAIGLTFTVALAAVVPPGPMTEIVFVVLSVGDTIMEPFAETVPIP